MIMVLLFAGSLFAQIGTSTNGSNPDVLAMLDLKSTTKGVLLPTYNTILIGSQGSMAENLATAKYNDGTCIPLRTDNTTWENFPTPGYCWYNNDQPTYGITYGEKYNWYTVTTGNLCPTGWHEPTDAEWMILTTNLGGLSVNYTKLKETGTRHWISPNTGTINEYGFTTLLGNMHWYNGDFIGTGIQCYLWSAVERLSDDTWRLYMSYTSSNPVIGYSWNINGSPVRCLRD